MNKEKIIFIGLIYLRISAYSQQSTNSVGSDIIGGTGSVAFTIGQIDYSYHKGTNGEESQGIQQAFELFADGFYTPTQLGDLIISNYISPNNDGQNDTWKVTPTQLVKDYALEITNQWGNVVYKKSEEYQNEWDATDNGKPVLDGVYYYTFTEGKKIVYRGSITVLKK